MIPVGTICVIVGPYATGQLCTVVAPLAVRWLDGGDGGASYRRAVYVIEAACGARNPDGENRWGAEPHELRPIAPPKDADSTSRIAERSPEVVA